MQQLTLCCVAALEPASPPPRPRVPTSAEQFLAVMAGDLAAAPDVVELLAMLHDDVLQARNLCEPCRLFGPASCRAEGCRAWRALRALALARVREIAGRLGVVVETRATR